MYEVPVNMLHLNDPSMDITTGDTYVKFDTEVDQISTHKSNAKLFFAIKISLIITTQLSETLVLYPSRNTWNNPSFLCE